ncbi:hypothetical protein K439DRAFT_1618389 [Ramaria rubella]|nr:hypothetical protein K439DRAFT_1618389 [Ramaria rubella]
MFACPPGENHICEGCTDANPIQLLLPVTKARFDHLMEWFYMQYSSKRAEDFSLDGLNSILTLGSYLQIDSAMMFTINELNTCTLSPIHKLIFGQKHGIPGWIAPATRSLLTMSNKFMTTLKQYDLLGQENLFIIFGTQSQIRAHRLAVAFTPPVVQHDFTACPHTFTCADTWAVAWWGGFARHYLHPDSPMSADTALAKLQTVFFPDITPECQHRTIERLSQADAFSKEETMITDAITRLESKGLK